MIVETAYGRVRGRQKKGEYTTFLGLPYASAPVGDRRWQPPVPPAPWAGIRDAGEFGSRAYQPPTAGISAAILPDENDSENCLFLNIWAPDPVPENCPVAIWIHGGGFMMGSGAWPNGANFAREGIVLVTINYRLGGLGFLCLDELFSAYSGSGNLGLCDQIAALKWVKENIPAFGGDADNITIFGESAGAMSVATLLGTPKAQGLFSKVIAQSGAAHHTRSKQVASGVAELICHELGVAPGDDSKLRSLPAAQITDFTTHFLMGKYPQINQFLIQQDPLKSDMLYAPVVDGELLAQRPIDTITQGLAKNVDLIVGYNEDEWRLVRFGEGMAFAESLPPPDLDSYAAATGLNGDDLLAKYQAISPQKNHLDLYSDIISDLYMTVPAQRLADAQSPHAKVYTYTFGWPTPVNDGILGACHALEIPFVFDLLNDTEVIVGTNPPQHLANLMQDAWMAFMRSGTPAGNNDWPSWSAEQTSNGPVMRFDVESRLVDSHYNERIALWPHW